VTHVLAAGTNADVIARETLFWILAVASVGAALAMILVRRAVHCAIMLAVVMLSLATFYAMQGAPFLAFVQIIVYTGAVLMLFLFVLMLIGIRTSDSLAETIKGQRLATGLAAIGFFVILFLGIGHAALGSAARPTTANDTSNLSGIAALIFTRYVFPFEATGALLITAALGAMVLAHRERTVPRPTQRDLAARRQASGQLAPDPPPGVYALHDAADRPALLPDGSTAELSVSLVLSQRAVTDAHGPAARAGPQTPARPVPRERETSSALKASLPAMPMEMPRNQKILLVMRFVAGIAGVIAGSLIYPTGRIVPPARAVPTALIIVGAIFAGHAVLDLAWAYLSDRDKKAAKVAAVGSAMDGLDLAWVVLSGKITASGAQIADQPFVAAKDALNRAWSDLSDRDKKAAKVAAAGSAMDALDLAWVVLSGKITASGAQIAVEPFVAAKDALDLAWAGLPRRDVPAPGHAGTQAAAVGAQAAVGSYVAAIATVLGLLAVFGTSPTFAVRLGALVLVIGAIVGLMVLLYVAYGIGGRATASLLAWIVTVLFGTTTFGLACIGLAVFFR
jgi:NADH-quinone oxidoreductase subunit J